MTKHSCLYSVDRLQNALLRCVYIWQTMVEDKPMPLVVLLPNVQTKILTNFQLSIPWSGNQTGDEGSNQPKW